MRPIRSRLLWENQWCSKWLCDQPLEKYSQTIFLWDTQSPPTSTRSPRQSTHSLWVPKLLCLRLSPILIGCLLSSSLLQFAKFKELLLFILLAFARSDSAWFLLFSPLYASWLLRQSFSLFICYLFSPPFLVGSWSILWHPVRSGYSSYNLFSLVGMQSCNGFSIFDLKNFQTSSTSSSSAELIN